jgi:hypothetical protein
MIQNIVKKTHVLESIWILEFSTLWMDLNIFYYAHNSKKNIVEIRLQLLGVEILFHIYRLF